MIFARRPLAGLILALIILPLIPVSAEKSEDSGPTHILHEMEYITDKYTRESALIRKLNIQEGKSFESREALEEFLADKAQDLVNLRVFNKVDYRLEKLESRGEENSYRGIIIVEGSWTLYAIPYPKYDSNSGFRGGLKIYYDNFLGTLTNCFLGMNIDIRPEGDGWVIPQWSINPRISNLTLFGQDFSLDLMQQYQETGKYNDEIDEYIEKYTYHSSYIALTTTLKFPKDFYYSFSPQLTFYYGYEDQLPDNGSNIAEEDINFSFTHGTGRNQIDWHGNFRKGLAYSLSNTLSYVTEDQLEGELRSNLWTSLTAFYPWGRINPSFKLSGFYNFNYESSKLGSRLRGVRDDSLYGFTGGFLNTSLNVSVIRWEGVAEAQFQPFFDVGVVRREGEDYSWRQDFKYGTGADFILYLDKLKSLVAVGSIGIDLTNPDWSDDRKYEITIESKLFY